MRAPYCKLDGFLILNKDTNNAISFFGKDRWGGGLQHLLTFVPSLFFFFLKDIEKKIRKYKGFL